MLGGPRWINHKCLEAVVCMNLSIFQESSPGPRRELQLSPWSAHTTPFEMRRPSFRPHTGYEIPHLPQTSIFVATSLKAVSFTTGTSWRSRRSLLSRAMELFPSSTCSFCWVRKGLCLACRHCCIHVLVRLLVFCWEIQHLEREKFFEDHYFLVVKVKPMSKTMT